MILTMLEDGMRAGYDETVDVLLHENVIRCGKLSVIK